MKQIVSIAFLCIVTQLVFAQTLINSNDRHLRYMGRVKVNADSAELSWSGTSVTINFKGTGIKALLRDQSGINWFKVIVDGQLLPDIKPDSNKQWYTLVSGLPAGAHTLELFKRTEWIFGSTWFYGFQLDQRASIAKASPAKKHRIEFYGNSITCGYAVLDTTGKDRGTAPYEDNYLSYAAITARHFNAEYSCIARSGIGVMISWFPQIMSEMYDRLNGGDENSKWDFSLYKPDVVVINLFQNDSWLVLQPKYPEFKHRFDTTAPTPARIIDAYESLVRNIRNKYPKANIICALGSMDATREGSPGPVIYQKR